MWVLSYRVGFGAAFSQPERRASHRKSYATRIWGTSLTAIPLTFTPRFLPSVPRENKKTPDPQAVPAEEAPLPELFGDKDNWDQLLNSFGECSHKTLQLCWSPPPTPSGTSSPQTPRIVRQISISEVPALQFAQEPASDPDPGARGPPGVPLSARDSRGVEDPKGQDAQDGDSKQPVDTPDLEATPKAPFLWSLPEVPTGESGNVRAAAFRVLLASEAEPPPQELSPPQSPAGSRKQSQTPDLGDKSLWPGPDPPMLPTEGDVLTEGLGSRGATEGPTEPSLSLEPVGQVPTERPVQSEASLARQESLLKGFEEADGQVLRLDNWSTHLLQSPEDQLRPEEGNSGEIGQQDMESGQANEAQGLESRDTESFQQDDPLSDTTQAPVEAEVPAPGKMSPPRGSPLLEAGLAVEAPETTEALLTLTETEVQPRPMSMPVQVESKPGAPQSAEPGAESRPEDPRTEAQEAEPTSSPGDLTAGKPQADPDYLYHVIFLGDSNVGKTSFLHLLHHDAFATGLTATVGKPLEGR